MSRRKSIDWKSPEIVVGLIAAAALIAGAIATGFFTVCAGPGGSTPTGATSGPNSPGTVVGNVNYDQRAGESLDDETVGKIIRRYEQTVVEKEGQVTGLRGQLSEKDELIARLKDGLDRVRAEAAKGDAAASTVLDELRKSGDTEKLQHLLNAERNQHKEEFIERSLEVAAIAFLRGDIPTTRTCLDEVLRLTPHDVRALNQLGHLERLLGNLDAAEQAYQHVLAAGKKGGDQMLQAVAYGNLGNVYATRGALDEAEAMYKKSLAIEEKLGRLEGMASDYGNLGVVYKKRGALDHAEEMYKKSLAINEKLGALEGMANQNGNLGNVYLARGALDHAEEMYKKSLAINEKLGSLGGMAIQYGNLGVVYMTRGELDESEAMYKKSLAINEKLGRLEGMASDYGNLGIVYQTRGALDEAEAMYKKALEITEKIASLEVTANQFCNLATLHKLRGDKSQAREYWTKARDLFAQIGMPHMVKKVQGWLDGLDP